MGDRNIKLNSGALMPMFGLGTWQLNGDIVTQAVKVAIDNGYRLIDTAHLYENHIEIGKAIKEKIQDGTVKREDLFITSKLWCTAHAEHEVRPALMKSLQELQLDYLDLYLIHWPFAFKGGTDNAYPCNDKGELQHTDTHYIDAWRGMEKCVDEGLIKSIGLSNFSSGQLQTVIDKGRIKPAVLQVEISPHFSNEKLVKYAQDRGVVVNAYGTFGSAAGPWGYTMLTIPEILNIGKKYGKTVGQVISRWIYQRRIVSIPKSTSPGHIKENNGIYDFQLSKEDMDIMYSLNQDKRLLTYQTLQACFDDVGIKSDPMPCHACMAFTDKF